MLLLFGVIDKLDFFLLGTWYGINVQFDIHLA